MKKHKLKSIASRLPDPLSEPEITALEKAEQTIKDAATSPEQVGQALAKIKDGKLYRRLAKTFEQYCRSRWCIGRAHAYRLLATAALNAQLRADKDLARVSPSGDILVPYSESHVRKLLKVPEEHRVAAWKKAVELAGENPVTAQHLKKVLEPYLPAKSQAPMTLRDWVCGELGRLERKVCEGVSPEEIIEDIHAIKSKLEAGSKRQVTQDLMIERRLKQLSPDLN